MTDQRIALVVANFKFDDLRIPELKAPAKDADELTELLRDPLAGNFDKVISLINENSQTVMKEIISLFRKRQLNDFLLLYYSGHGILDYRRKLHLATLETAPDFLKATSISADFITDEMDESRSKRQLLILDCCNSGSVVKGGKSVLGMDINSEKIFKGNGHGRVILTATDEMQLAMEGDQIIGDIKNSLFTYYLLQGIKTGEANPENQFIDVDGVFNYITQNIGQIQNPLKHVYKQDGPIYIAINPQYKKVKLDEELFVALKSKRERFRQVALQELIDLANAENEFSESALKEIIDLASNDSSESVKSEAKNFIDIYETKKKIKELETQLNNYISIQNWKEAELTLKELHTINGSHHRLAEYTSIIAKGKRSYSYKVDILRKMISKFAFLIGDEQNEMILFSNGEKHKPGLGMQHQRNFLREYMNTGVTEALQIVVLGEFKNGKTTLINALLGDHMLPTRVIPTTAYITKLVYGSELRVFTYDRDQDGTTAPKEISFENFIQSFQIDEDIDRGYTKRPTAHIRIEYPAPILLNGLTIIDTPGLGEEVNRNIVTLDFTRYASAIIIVLNVFHPLSLNERDLISSITSQEGLRSRCFVVVNGIDRLRDDEFEQVKNFLDKKLENYFVDSKGNLDMELYKKRVFFLSAKTALDAFKSNESTDLHTLSSSGFLAFKQSLEDFINSDQTTNDIFTVHFKRLEKVYDEVVEHIEHIERTLNETPKRFNTDIQSEKQSELTRIYSIKRECSDLLEKMQSEILNL